MIFNEETRKRLNERYLNLHTQFKCNGTIKKTDFSTTACFAPALKTAYTHMDNTYEIKIYKKALQSADNYLFFSLDEVHRYFRYLKEIVNNFEYTISYEDEEYIIINIHINDNHFIHTFVITAIRYLYEKRYAIILQEAMRLRKTYLFKDMNILSLMALVLNANKGLRESVSNDMSHFNYDYNHPFGIISNSEIKERIINLKDWYEESEEGDYKLMKMNRITNIIPYYDSSLKICINHETGLNSNDTNISDNLENGFIKRYIKYRSLYKKLKDLSYFDSKPIRSTYEQYIRRKHD